MNSPDISPSNLGSSVEEEISDNVHSEQGRDLLCFNQDYSLNPDAQEKCLK